MGFKTSLVKSSEDFVRAEYWLNTGLGIVKNDTLEVLEFYKGYENIPYDKYLENAKKVIKSGGTSRYSQMKNANILVQKSIAAKLAKLNPGESFYFLEKEAPLALSRNVSLEENESLWYIKEYRRVKEESSIEEEEDLLEDL